MQDLTIALRLLRKNRGFTVAAVLSLAPGIDANAAVFSLVDAFLLRMGPVRDAGELILLATTEGARGQMSRGGENNGYRDPSGHVVSTSFPLLAFARMRERTPDADLFAFAPFSQVNVMVDGVPETSATAQLMSGNYHAALGVAAAIGRTLTSADDRAGARPVAVISYRYWQRRFGGDPAVVVLTLETVSDACCPTSVAWAARCVLKSGLDWLNSRTDSRPDGQVPREDENPQK